MKRVVWLILGIALAAGIFGWLNRDTIRMRMLERGAAETLSRDVLAELGPDALHVGFCGTGSPLPNRDRGEACTVVIAAGKLFIFDAGEGAARTLGGMGLPLGRVEGVWLTHLHSDHFNGLGNLALQRWAGTSATTPLAVFGPTGVREVTDGLTAAYRIDSTYRIAHHGEAVIPPSGFGLAGSAIAPGVVYDRDGVKITAFAVNHAPVTPAFGYRVDWKGKSVTITGDTAPFAALAAAAAKTDVLVSEVLSPRMVKVLVDTLRRTNQPNRAKVMSDIPGYHISPEAAADLATAAKVGLLAFTHIVPSVPGALEGALIGDAGSRFAGPIWIMRDGDLISIGDGKPVRRNLLD
jgi:ribonuclease Z